MLWRRVVLWCCAAESREVPEVIHLWSVGVLLSVVECCGLCWLVTSSPKKSLVISKKVTPTLKSQKIRKNLGISKSEKFRDLEKTLESARPPPAMASTPVRGPILAHIYSSLIG